MGGVGHVGIVKHARVLHGNTSVGRGKRETGIGPKNLMGVPWMVAFALRADGWTLRSDIIWHKLNVMPTSVTDRPTTNHEHVFLLSKQATYFYDQDAVREPFAESTLKGQSTRTRVNGQKAVDATPGRSRQAGLINVAPHPGGRNMRTVQSIAPSRVGGHSAAMPAVLADICIRAGSKRGDIVLDPFAGSGTTPMVARHLERNYIGIEINEAYRPVIEGRLARADQSRAELDAFRQAAGVHSVALLDDERHFEVVAKLINIDNIVAATVAAIRMAGGC